ncbi:MAG: hypothetical protein HFF50_07610 [Lawsonibacter sp.]|nr:hypothetical protein [Lawsonibacter sp.]
MWKRRPRLGRRGKIAWNLLVSLLLLLYIWGQFEYPLPFLTWEFRRLERVNLMPRSEILFSGRASKDIWELDGYVLQLSRDVVLGRTPDGITTAVLDYAAFPRRTGDGMIDRYPLEEGPCPTPFGFSLGHLSGEGNFGFVCLLSFLQVPPETARAELTVDMVYQDVPYHWRGQGFFVGNTVWFFPLDTPEGGYSDHWYCGADYTLRLYRGDGSLLLEKEGAIPWPD